MSFVSLNNVFAQAAQTSAAQIAEWAKAWRIAVESGSQVVGVGGVCGCVWPAAWPCSAPPSWPSAARRPLRLQRSESWSPAVIIQTA